ncbi:MAG: hypothetical protein LBF66_00400 [Holosporales bacterium]|nr:hypothetical protein [Holosporales bacterium]
MQIYPNCQSRWVYIPSDIRGFVELQSIVKPQSSTRRVSREPCTLAFGVSFNDDKACIRNDNAAENMDVLRKWALTILDKAKDKKDRSARSLRRRNAMSLHHLIECIKKISPA